MSGQLPPKTSLDHSITNGRLDDEEVAHEADHASGKEPFHISLLHLDSPEARARMGRAIRLILRPRDTPEE